MSSQGARVPDSLSTPRRPAPLPPRALLRTSDRRSSAPPVSPGIPQASSPTSRGRASNDTPLTQGTRAGAMNAALPNHAPSSTKSVAPSGRSFQRGCPPPTPRGHAVTVGLRCGKANTETPRSRLTLDSGFSRNNNDHSTLFPIKEESPRPPSPPDLQDGSPLRWTLCCSPSGDRSRSRLQGLQALFRLRPRHSTCAARLRLQQNIKNLTLPVEPVVSPRPPVRSTGQHTR